MNAPIRPKVLGIAAAVAVGATLASPLTRATQTYYIDEGTDFTNGNPCDIYDVNTITASLQTALGTDGWTGNRYVNDSAWPQDFWEECSSTYGTGGEDLYYGDNGVLSVYAGHGSPHYLYFGSYHGSACTVSMTDNARLGEMAAAQGAFGMWLACEVIQGADLGTNEYQWLRQQAGWQNTISIGDDEPRDFYNATSSSTNADAWLNQMSSGGRDAIIATTETYTSGSTGDSCWSVHNSAKLKGNIFNTPRGGGPSCGNGPPEYWYCYEHQQD
jgi:hypothetical protein